MNFLSCSLFTTPRVAFETTVWKVGIEKVDPDHLILKQKNHISVIVTQFLFSQLSRFRILQKRKKTLIFHSHGFSPHFSNLARHTCIFFLVLSYLHFSCLQQTEINESNNVSLEGILTIIFTVAQSSSALAPASGLSFHLLENSLLLHTADLVNSFPLYINYPIPVGLCLTQLLANHAHPHLFQSPQRLRGSPSISDLLFSRLKRMSFFPFYFCVTKTRYGYSFQFCFSNLPIC